ncbi:hypothetical protein EPN42_15970 [bacterium]|nr:MAG: hypothetical protein EPN42_15970 [bacterium]
MATGKVTAQSHTPATTPPDSPRSPSRAGQGDASGSPRRVFSADPSLATLRERRQPRDASQQVSGEQAIRPRAAIPLRAGALASDAERPRVNETNPEAHREHFAAGLGRALKVGLKAGVAAFVVSAGYRAVRNPGDFISHPGATLMGVANLYARTGETVPRQAMNDVLEHYGNHIPAHSACFRVKPTIVPFIGTNVVGQVGRDRTTMEPTDLKLARYAGFVSGISAGHHEYLHCFTHPQFLKAIKDAPLATSINEALTEYFSDNMPAPALSKYSAYDSNKLANGKKWTAAAAELEAVVGKDTLHRAYFGGEAAAIKQVTAAIVDIWPKTPLDNVWRTIRFEPQRYKQALGECFVGLSLWHTNQMPKLSGYHYAFDLLPIAHFSNIRQKDAARMVAQAKAAHKRLGPALDQAFFNMDNEASRGALRQIRGDLLEQWEPVLRERV